MNILSAFTNFKLPLVSMTLGVALMFSFLQANSQCYTQLDDASGYDRSSSFHVVEDAACRLLDFFPPELRDSFGIYGFGFYRLVDHYNDYSHEDIFEEVIENEVDKPYYIVFGRESDKSGLYTKYHVKVNSSFCLVQGNEASEAWIENELNKVLDDELSSPSRWAEAEKSAIYRYLEIYMPSNDCCDQYWKGSGCGLGCIWTKERVLEYLQANNFTTELCSSNFQGTIDSCICDYQYSFTYNNIDSGSYKIDYQTSISSIDHKGRTVTFDSLYKFLNSLAQEYKDQSVKFYGAITDQTIFCYGAPALTLREQTSKSSSELNFRNVESRYNEAEVAVWYSVYYEEGESYLSVKVKGLNTDGMPTELDCGSALLAKDKQMVDFLEEGLLDASDALQFIRTTECECPVVYDDYRDCVEGEITSFFTEKAIDDDHSLLVGFFDRTLSCESFDFRSQYNGDGWVACVDGLYLSKEYGGLYSQTKLFCLHFTLPRERYDGYQISLGQASDCAAWSMNAAAVAAGYWFASKANQPTDEELIRIFFSIFFKQKMKLTSCGYGVSIRCENVVCPTSTPKNAIWNEGFFDWLDEQLFGCR